MPTFASLFTPLAPRMARLELKLWNSSRRLWSRGAVRLKSRPSTMTFRRLAARLVQMLLRQVWPPAGCAQQAVPPGAPRSIAARARAALARLERCHLQPAEQHPRSTGVAVAFSSASSELWALKRAQRQQLKADFNAAAALPLKLGMHSCKELREAKTVEVRHRADRLSEDDLDIRHAGLAAAGARHADPKYLPASGCSLSTPGDRACRKATAEALLNLTRCTRIVLRGWLSS